MVKRVLIAVGGTGGHIYPAIALARKLKEQHPDIYLMFAGGGLNESRFFNRAEFPYDEVACGYFPLRKPLTLLKNLGKVASGIWQSELIIKSFKPNIVVGFGSYHSLPILLSAKMHSIPIILHEGNAIPGKVNRLLARHALFTGIQFPGAAPYLRGKTVEVEPPLREELLDKKTDREGSYRHFSLHKGKATLLVFGGSQGAFAINSLIMQALASYSGDLEKLQLLHFTGADKESRRAKALYDKIGINHVVKDFEPEIGKAWAVADLVVGRAGAGTIAEAIEFEVPALLIPYPHATDGHQEKNGEFFSLQVGGAIVFNQERTSSDDLAAKISFLLDQEPEACEKMRQAIRNYKLEGQRQEMSALVAEVIR